MKKKIVWTLIILISILAITNPTQTDFERFANIKVGTSYSSGTYQDFSETQVSYICSRTGYFLLFSIYEYDKLEITRESHYGRRIGGEPPKEHHSKKKYLGIFKNFIDI